ncbi:hypothetical protein WG66_001352 [Moniliophthora roreri]|nr:hypothetical protein WG66_001352 [Moniliophthora roreri]
MNAAIWFMELWSVDQARVLQGISFYNNDIDGADFAAVFYRGSFNQNFIDLEIVPFSLTDCYVSSCTGYPISYP